MRSLRNRFRVDCNSDGHLRLRKFNRILNEINEDLLNASFVNHDDRVEPIQLVEFQANILRFHLHHKQVNYRLEDVDYDIVLL